MPRSPLDRREFFHKAGHSALALGAAACVPLLAFATDAPLASPPAPESLVKLLFESLTPGQRERVCFAWDHQHPEWGLLRTRVSANWNITDEVVDSKFYTPEQQELVHAIYRGIIAPEWHERYDRQQDDDAGGFGANNSIAIFGTPGDGPSELVLTGRHMTLRCDGNSAEHIAFGGPIFYGHDPTSTQEDDASHEGSVFWSQALEANSLYQALDGKQQQLALVKRLPGESQVAFRGAKGQFDGIPVTEFSADQKARVQEVLRKLIEPFRQSDRDEALACLSAQGGLDACSLAFYQPGDIGNDKVWDNWRLEGPSFVWHFRGAPHVHTWVNIADNPSVKLNA
ncbi:DUF3500 domain-containing protein [Lacipirellula parvula]|uniref:DUF3500 domain-containing protein n=1 Tax=Lacipirellula parvula TaxID=2650471 RepID=A0A5K7X639_9BACT|nr:DUF3500 domain-containing protein [Lacipirellula parvula]BBO32030.1 hypothetical protein PLANPX_1642 [Lacipirellula parvula]